MPIQFGWSDTLHAMSTCFSCNAQASSSADSLNNYAPNASNPRTTGGNRIGPSHSSQSLPEALRPLLMNDSTDDEYADSLSLHSNIGESGGKKNKSRTRPPRPGAVALSETDTDGEDTTAALTRNMQSRTKSKRRGKKKQRNRGTDGWFTVFGYHLFGKKQPAIQLPLTDDEEEDEEEEAERRRRRVMRLSGNGSGTTLDSDAAPLDDAAIAAAVGRAHIVRDNEDTAPVDPMNGAVTAAGVTSGNVDEALARHADKAERRRKRREWKEREALERALSSGFSRISSLNSFNDEEGEFEGFQGSGDGASLVALKSPPSERTSASSKREAKFGASGMDEEDEVADFDGSLYARPIQTNSDPLKTSESRTTTTSTATRSSNSTPAPSGRRSSRLSHHRARSNVSSNDAADDFHEAIFNTSSSIAPRETSSNDREDRKTKKSKIRSKPSPLAPSSTATSSQSPSLPSPPGSAALGPGLSTSLSMPPSSSQTVTGAAMPTKNTNTKPEMVPGLGLEDPFLIAPRAPTSAYGLDSGNRGFPSVGFGRRNSTHLNGAFLARRGD
ncbi:hypothetical protein JOM56_012508 [Amanita muscaria]